MKRIFYISVSICLIALVTVKLWPSQSDTDRAFSIVRKACGLQEKDGNWEFAPNRPFVNFEKLSPEEQKDVEGLSEKSTMLAQQASFLDQRWEKLADAFSVIHISQSWIRMSLQVGDFSTNVTDSNIKVLYTCKAIREQSNS